MYRQDETALRDELPPGAGGIVLEKKAIVHWTVGRGRSCSNPSMEVFRKAVVISEEGADLGTIVLPPVQRDAIEILEGTLRRKDGTVEELTKNGWSERVLVEGFHGSSDLVETVASFSNVSPGDEICFHYHIRGYGEYRWDFLDRYPVEKSIFTVRFPREEMHLVSRRVADLFPVRENRKKGEIRWEAVNLRERVFYEPLIEKGKDALISYSLRPKGRDTIEWKDVGASILEAVNGDPYTDWDGNSELNRLVSDIIVSNDVDTGTPFHAMKALYTYVQKELKTADLSFLSDGTPLPTTPWNTVSYGNGNSMDLAYLYKSLLQKAWIEGVFLVLVQPGSGEGVIESFPSLEQFSHVLVYLPAGVVYRDYKLDTELWLDPSTPACPFGMLPPAMEGIRGLLLHPEGARLIDTPLSVAGDNRTERIVDITIDRLRTVRADVETSFNGNRKILMNGHFQDKSNYEHNRYMEQRAHRGSPEAELHFYAVSGIGIPGESLEMYYILNMFRGAHVIGDLLLFKPSVLIRLDPLAGFPEKSTPGEVRFFFPEVIEEYINVKIPEGYTPVEHPQSISMENPYFVWKVQAERDSAGLKMNAYFELKARTVPPEEYESVRRISRAIGEFWNTTLQFRLEKDGITQ
jgi:hypothetical protein